MTSVNLTNDELSAIEAEHALTTPGKWVALGPDEDNGGDYWIDTLADVPDGQDNIAQLNAGHHQVKENALFIANAHQNVQRLIATVKSLQAENESLRREIHNEIRAHDEFCI